MADIVVFGAGRIAATARAYIDRYGTDRIVGFTVDRQYKTEDTFEGLPLVEWERLEERFPPGDVKLLGPISYRRLNDFRMERYLEGKKRGYDFASFVHPDSAVETGEIGENAFILSQVVIEPFARIGVCAIVWNGSHVGHHSIVGDYVFVGGRSAVGSVANVGDRTFIGSCVVVESGTSVGEACFIASAAYVQRDLASETVVIGAERASKPFKSGRLKRLL